MKDKRKESEQKIHIVEEESANDECNCEKTCDCEDTCNCAEECSCQNDDECNCENSDCDCNGSKEEEYLNLLRIVQADFDNYRKRSVIQLEKAKTDGIAQTIEIFLPSLDAFKNVKSKIKDDTTREGVEMLEKQIMANLFKLGVEKIDAIGKPLDPNLHNAVAVAKDESKEDGIILDEFQAGYRLGDKIIRYSQVLVNKL